MTCVNMATVGKLVNNCRHNSVRFQSLISHRVTDILTPFCNLSPYKIPQFCVRLHTWHHFFHSSTVVRLLQLLPSACRGGSNNVTRTPTPTTQLLQSADATPTEIALPPWPCCECDTVAYSKDHTQLLGSTVCGVSIDSETAKCISHLVII